MPLSPDDDATWNALRGQWALRPDVVYLNHGSFGPAPRPVLAAQQRWRELLQGDPMDFLFRRMEGELAEVRRRLGAFVGAPAGDLILVDNATMGMNIVAVSLRLTPGDEILATDHEYGANLRLWERVCRRSGARLVVRRLPARMDNRQDVADAILAGLTERTRLVVVSHVTSATAVVLPVEEICHRARARGVPVCVDGPHAVAMLPLDLARLDCDYYAASCHKWLSAAFGSGFLYVHPRAQAAMEPVLVSWGPTLERPPGMALPLPPQWWEEFVWLGTRDPSAWLSVPAAIDFMESIGLEAFRRRTHELARGVREAVCRMTGLEPLVPDDPAWYGSMIALPLPGNDAKGLQNALWERYHIEVLVVPWQGGRLLRPSCHAYTRREDLDLLVRAVRELM